MQVKGLTAVGIIEEAASQHVRHFTNQQKRKAEEQTSQFLQVYRIKTIYW